MYKKNFLISKYSSYRLLLLLLIVSVLAMIVMLRLQGLHCERTSYQDKQTHTETAAAKFTISSP